MSNSLLKQELPAPGLIALTASLAAILQKNGWRMSTAESCTGGMIAAACTDLPGSSVWFDRGFVTYSNEAKTDMLGVPAELIGRHGAVSEEVARAMAQGAVTHSLAQAAVAVTGVAGPSGGSAEKPVGTVWLAWATPAGVISERCHFDGDRAAVRQATVLHALQRLVELLASQPTNRLIAK
ncbi:nicotinamide-nucleotide amidase [Polaromonas sp. CG_9.5]|uniref:CinA family protein n=1 Tax=Polaromonas sp. CG_9.5 TaxID=3071705 RepID=UPI002E026B3E|nr:nicotinamide-nucleotide amidase [Polaromonas sp. CG_9.5]